MILKTKKEEVLMNRQNFSPQWPITIVSTEPVEISGTPTTQGIAFGT